MTGSQQAAAQQLIAYGFDPEFARKMARGGILPCPLPVDVQKNAELLKCCIDPKEIPQDEYDRMAVFLRRDHYTNMLLAAVPDRYGFSPEQQASYYSRPFEWEITCDLMNEMDAELQKVVPKQEERMKIYREMYCNGAWWDCDTIRHICRELTAIANGQSDLYTVVNEWWFILFSLYSGTLQYIEKLKELFEKEFVWLIFRETIMNVREFAVQFNPFDRKDAVIDKLKYKYAAYLRKA